MIYTRHIILSVHTVAEVVRYEQYDNQGNAQSLHDLLQQLGLTLKLVSANEEIPGSFWGEEEAGLIKQSIYGRPDTPIHSFMHEACHYACMDQQRRLNLHTNAGGTSDEENAVCYLQIVLADGLPGYGRATMFKDMDSWGYSFRLGSTKRWFDDDAEDARQWLESKQLLELANQLTQLNRAALG